MTLDRAYALVNPMEYFAETTEAFFSRNDFFPFIRSRTQTAGSGEGSPAWQALGKSELIKPQSLIRIPRAPGQRTAPGKETDGLRPQG